MLRPRSGTQGSQRVATSKNVPKTISPCTGRGPFDSHSKRHCFGFFTGALGVIFYVFHHRNTVLLWDSTDNYHKTRMVSANTVGNDHRRIGQRVRQRFFGHGKWRVHFFNSRQTALFSTYFHGLRTPLSFYVSRIPPVTGAKYGFQTVRLRSSFTA